MEQKMFHNDIFHIDPQLHFLTQKKKQDQIEIPWKQHVSCYTSRYFRAEVFCSLI